MPLRNLIRPIVATSALLIAIDAQAFDPFAALANNIYYGGHDCSAIEMSHLAKLQGVKCSQFGVDAIPSTMPLETVKSTLFARAQNLAKQKNTCLMDYGHELAKSPEAMKEYRQKVTVLWLNRKKAQAIINECQKIDGAMPYQDHSDPLRQGKESIALTSQEAAYFSKYHPDLKVEYYATCRTPAQMAALRGVVSLTDVAAPFLSSAGLYDLMDENRSAFLSAKTGQPVTDDEIRDYDATSEVLFVKTDPLQIPVLQNKFNSYFEKMGRDRSKFLKTVEGDFSESKMGKLFEEGSAPDSMYDMGFANEAAAKDPDVARIHYCVRSIYEKNNLVDVAETIALFAAIRRVTPAGLTALVSSRAGAWAPETLTWLVASAKPIAKSCAQLRAGDFKLSGRDEAFTMNVGVLPKGFDVDLLKLEALPMENVGSCKALGMTRLFARKNLQTSCAFEITTAAIPAVTPGTLGKGLSFIRGKMGL